MTDNTIAGAMANRAPANAAAFGSNGSNSFVFEPATKEQAKARIALHGPSGCGKTWTALRTAASLGGPIAVVDTERNSAKKYAGRGPNEFQFNHLSMHRYNPNDLISALASAAAGGHETVIIDSLTHFWSGIDGMLEQVDAAGKRSFGGNSFGGWKEMSPVEKRMIDALVSYPGHVIVTMRVKTEFVIGTDDRGRQVPRKIGMRPEQRQGIEYEFDIVGEMDLENTLVLTKSRCFELSGAVIRKPDAAFGQTVLAWLEDGVEADTVASFHDEALDPSTSVDDLYKLYARVERAGLLGAALLDPDANPTTLGSLIKAIGTARRAGDSDVQEAAKAVVAKRKATEE